jgi:hypothetical protein
LDGKTALEQKKHFPKLWYVTLFAAVRLPATAAYPDQQARADNVV